MNKTLVFLIIAMLVLSWNFVFTDSKKIDLTDPTKVLQGLSMALNYKVAVKEIWQTSGILPDAEEWRKADKKMNVDISKSLVKSIEVGADGPGVITVYLMNKETIKLAKDITGKKALLIPVVKGEHLVWSCKSTLDNEFLPKKCEFIQSN